MVLWCVWFVRGLNLMMVMAMAFYVVVGIVRWVSLIPVAMATVLPLAFGHRGWLLVTLVESCEVLSVWLSVMVEVFSVGLLSRGLLAGCSFGVLLVAVVVW